eukprot:2119809-Prymnesium_polylepis.1
MLRRAQSPAAGSHGLRRAQLPAAWFSGCVGHGRRQHGSWAEPGAVAGRRQHGSTGCVWAQSPAAGFHGRSGSRRALPRGVSPSGAEHVPPFCPLGSRACVGWGEIGTFPSS